MTAKTILMGDNDHPLCSEECADAYHDEHNDASWDGGHLYVWGKVDTDLW